MLPCVVFPFAARNQSLLVAMAPTNDNEAEPNRLKGMGLPGGSVALLAMLGVLLAILVPVLTVCGSWTIDKICRVIYGEDYDKAPKGDHHTRRGSGYKGERSGHDPSGKESRWRYQGGIE